MAPPVDYPITGVCIVADPEKCPPGYELIYKSFDKRDDCDLWKDGFFSSRVTRYLCVTRVFPLDSGRLNNVLGDVVLNNEREPPYPGFSLIDKTVDTGEQSTKKKQLCVKMLPRNTTLDAICDIIMLSKAKRAPAGYTLVGEINGLLLCYKMGKVPADTQTIEPVESITRQDSTSAQATPPVPLQNEHHHDRPEFMRQKTITGGHALHDVPFTLSSKYQGMMQLQDFSAPVFNFCTLNQLDNKYNYPFRLERQAASQTVNREN